MTTPVVPPRCCPGDGTARDQPPPRPLILILDRLRSAYNVGNIFRLAEACAVQEIIGCGYTPMPPHPKLEKTARGCEFRIPSRQMPDCFGAIRDLQKKGWCVAAVETVEQAATPWETNLTWPLALVFGNEALGIEPKALAACDLCLRLPVFGWKNSLNVSNCAAAVVYAVLPQRLAKK